MNKFLFASVSHLLFEGGDGLLQLTCEQVVDFPLCYNLLLELWVLLAQITKQVLFELSNLVNWHIIHKPIYPCIDGQNLVGH
jgi:hypothetical protein